MNIKKALVEIVLLGACVFGGCNASSSLTIDKEIKPHTSIGRVTDMARESLECAGYKTTKYGWNEYAADSRSTSSTGYLEARKRVSGGEWSFCSTEYRAKVDIKKPLVGPWKYNVSAESSNSSIMYSEPFKRDISEEKNILDAIKARTQKR